MVEALSRVVIVFAGDSGDGMQLTGGRFSTDAAIQGNDIATLPDYPAEIRAPQGSLGGVSSFQVHFADEDVTTPGEDADVLVAMNPAALKIHIKTLKSGAIIITDISEYTRRNLKNAGWESNPLDDETLDAFQVFGIDISALTTQAAKPFGLNRKSISRTRNMTALGVVSWLYSRDISPTEAWLARKFAATPDIRDANIAALKAGWNFGETAELFTTRYEVSQARLPAGIYRQISGNNAIAHGLVTASFLSRMPLFLGAYPITPASDILHFLARLAPLGVQVFQAEDEIAAVGAALGASYGGALGVCTTSGPGFTLKQEMINLAVMTELPLVVVDVQRAGPSTGMPTKPEQSDLMQAIWGRNGDSPIPVIAARSASHCFDAAIQACRVAVEYRTPVVLLTDAYIANGSEPWRILDLGDLEPIHPGFATAKPPSPDGETPVPGSAFMPYARDRQTLIRNWAIPGTPGLEHRVGGLEKSNPEGAISYDPANHDEMTRIRQRRIEQIPLAPAWLDDPDGSAQVLALGWGSTWGSIAAACRRLRHDSIPVAQLHLDWVNPLPANLADILKRYRTVLVCEMNTGQLWRTLRAEFLVDAHLFSRVTGQPLPVSELCDELRRLAHE